MYQTRLCKDNTGALKAAKIQKRIKNIYIVSALYDSFVTGNEFLLPEMATPQSLFRPSGEEKMGRCR
ncbi:MAG: hypothetical protein MK052_04695 [Alphaproteobacteria bacterium]|nr:hypothetical protein [Alphaproteobacteria bacterium]